MKKAIGLIFGAIAVAITATGANAATYTYSECGTASNGDALRCLISIRGYEYQSTKYDIDYVRSTFIDLYGDPRIQSAPVNPELYSLQYSIGQEATRRWAYQNVVETEENGLVGLARFGRHGSYETLFVSMFWPDYSGEYFIPGAFDYGRIFGDRPWEPGGDYGFITDINTFAVTSVSEVPLPGTLGLLGMGLAGLGFARRKTFQ